MTKIHPSIARAARLTSVAAIAGALTAFPAGAWARGGGRGGAGRGVGAGAAGGRANQNPNSANTTNPSKPDDDSPTKMDPAAERKESAEKFEQALADGVATKDSLSSLLEAGSTGSFPSRKATRDDLADKLGSVLMGKPLTKAQAHSLADALATAADPDGLTLGAVTAKQGTVASMVSTLKGTADEKKQVSDAYGKVVAEQIRPAAQKLATDLAAIKDAENLSAAQKQQLAVDVGALVKTTAKPSKQSVTALGSELGKDFGGKEFKPPEKAQLARDIEAVLNSATASTDDMKPIFSDIESIAQSATVDEKDVQSLSSDLQAVYQSFPHKLAKAN